MKSHLFWLSWLLALALTSPTWGHGSGHEQIDKITTELIATPTEAALFRERARLYYEDGDFDRALMDTATWRLLAPSDDIAVVLQARIYRATKRPALAVVAMRYYLAHHPRDFEGLRELALAQAATGDTTAALAGLDKAIALHDRPSPELVVERFKLSKAQDPRAALAWLKERLALQPLPVLEEHALAVEIDLKDRAAAEARLTRLAASHPRPAALHERRAAFLADLGDLAAAKTAARDALAALTKLPPHLLNAPDTKALREKCEALLAK
jgi:hypothetical protein